MSTIVPDDAMLQHEIEKLAVKAGRMILNNPDFTTHTKSGRRDLVTSKDLEIQKMLMQRLDILASPCRFLCEEDLFVDSALARIKVVTDPKQINRGTCFIIDPIDGTANFVHGQQHSCTSIAMTVNGETRIGVIYDPYRQELFSACRGRGAWLNGHRLPVFDAPLKDAITVFGTAPYDESTNEPTFKLAHLLYELSADVRRTGSAALDLCWTACGRFGLYAELGLSPWDYAAGKLIAEEAGCRETDIKGQPLRPANIRPRISGGVLLGKNSAKSKARRRIGRVDWDHIASDQYQLCQSRS